MAKDKKFIQIDHTADLGVEVYGDTLEELFDNAAKALFYFALKIPTDILKKSKSSSEKLKLKNSSAEELLIDFLNQLIYSIYTENKAVLNTATSIKNGNLKSKIEYIPSIAGRYIDEEIKAATYHNVNIRQKDGKLSTEIIFDI